MTTWILVSLGALLFLLTSHRFLSIRGRRGVAGGEGTRISIKGWIWLCCGCFIIQLANHGLASPMWLSIFLAYVWGFYCLVRFEEPAE